MRPVKSLCVFCGSSVGNDIAFADAGRALGKQLAEQDITLVYGGGNLGVMGALSGAVLDNGGSVIGVVPEALNRYMRKLPKGVDHHTHSGSAADVSKTYDVEDNPRNRVIVVETMHERKALMYKLADAFVALPGGFGTWEELLEAVTHQQLGIHAKPVGLLNVSGFYDPLLNMVKAATGAGFLRASDASRLIVFTSVADVLPGLSRAERVPPVLQWHLDPVDL